MDAKDLEGSQYTSGCDSMKADSSAKLPVAPVCGGAATSAAAAVSANTVTASAIPKDQLRPCQPRGMVLCLAAAPRQVCHQVWLTGGAPLQSAAHTPKKTLAALHMRGTTDVPDLKTLMSLYQERVPKPPTLRQAEVRP